MCFGAHSNRHLPYPEEAPVLYCCIVLLRQQEPARSFSAIGCPRLGTRLGLSESRGTGTSVDCCTRSPGYGWYGGLLYIMCGPTSTHLHPRISSTVQTNTHIFTSPLYFASSWVSYAFIYPVSLALRSESRSRTQSQQFLARHQRCRWKF